MSFRATYQRRASIPGFSISENVDVNVKEPRPRIETIADGQTDVEIDFGIDVSELQVFAMQSTVDMTVKTNSSSSPQETFNITANKPVFWIVGEAAIFAGDVSSLFVTNASGNSGNLEILTGVSAA